MFRRNWNRRLLKAARGGGLEDVKTALENGANINTRDGDGCTPLLLAAWKGHEEVVQLLVEQNADANIQDKDKNTPLHTATRYNHTDIMRLLIDHGANLELTNKRGNTPLKRAYMFSRSEALKILVEAGADTGVLSLSQKSDYPETFHIQFIENPPTSQPPTSQSEEKPDWHKVNGHMIARYEGNVPGLGDIRKLFDFASKTVTQVIDKNPGPPCTFDQLRDNRDEILTAYEELCAKGSTPEHPFHARKQALSRSTGQ